MFRVATSPKGFAWSPATFWAATFTEYALAMDGASGRFDPAPIVSRQDIAFLARVHGKRPSIRNPKN
ncbi:phage tail assembly chaperone [Georhizobium profundi]|uniref:Phage tail assembly chaperone n=2 Tax=Georhizobium profundi TaxID=2341112 RepID=A0A3Q8XR53_9HYPH|nr:phage tail assembly chaperone [Georhizobium profundi]